MARRDLDYHEDDEDDLDGDGDDDLEETIPCPQCGVEIYEDAERCPRCGTYLTREALRGRPPWWVVLGVILCLIVVARWILF